MNKTISPDSIKLEKSFSEPFDLDIAKGIATLHKCEVHNILSAQVKKLRSKIQGDKLYALIDLIVPSINAIAYGEIDMLPKLGNIGPMRGIIIPSKIHTKGKIETTLTNIPLTLAFQFNMTDVPGNKKIIIPDQIDGKLDCSSRHDDKFKFTPEPAFGGRIAKIFTQLILNGKSNDVCKMIMEKDEHKDILRDTFKKRTLKHFTRVRFLNC